MANMIMDNILKIVYRGRVYIEYAKSLECL